MGFRIAITNILEVESTIEPNEPAGETEKEFCERRVDIKVIFACNVEGGEFSEMDFVKSGMKLVSELVSLWV
jgi:hypothetical protein